MDYRYGQVLFSEVTGDDVIEILAPIWCPCQDPRFRPSGGRPAGLKHPEGSPAGGAGPSGLGDGSPGPGIWKLLRMPRTQSSQHADAGDSASRCERKSPSAPSRAARSPSLYDLERGPGVAAGLGAGGKVFAAAVGRGFR